MSGGPVVKATTTQDPTVSVRPAAKGPKAHLKKSPRAVWHKWVRHVHGWLSMTSLLIVLFFALW